MMKYKITLPIHTKIDEEKTSFIGCAFSIVQLTYPTDTREEGNRELLCAHMSEGYTFKWGRPTSIALLQENFTEEASATRQNPFLPTSTVILFMEVLITAITYSYRS